MIESPHSIKMLRAALILAAAIGTGPAAAEKQVAEAQAKLVALHAATLSSEMAGRIDAIATRVGDRFRKGDVLVTFDCALPNTQGSHPPGHAYRSGEDVRDRPARRGAEDHRAA